MPGIFPKPYIAPFPLVGWRILECQLLLISSCLNNYAHNPHQPPNNILWFNWWISITSVNNCERQTNSPNPDSLRMRTNWWIFLLCFRENTNNVPKKKGVVNSDETWKIQKTASFPRLLRISSKRQSSPHCKILFSHDKSST